MKRLVALMVCAVSLGATAQLTFEFVFQSDSTVFLISDWEVNYWSEAEDICQSFGGHLATFSSLEENLTVFDIVGAGPWIGLIQSPEGDEPNGGWSWVNSESLLYENWFANEPNDNNSGEDFGQLYIDGGWNDIRNYDADPHRVLMEVSLSSNLVGCTNQESCNFDATATLDDGSCIPSGCTDSYACNFATDAACDDGSCDYSCCPGPGCCTEGMFWDWELSGCYNINPADINLDGCVQLNDLLDLLSAYGNCAAEESVWQCGDALEYQGYDYETVRIGEQCWFAENLRAENYGNGEAIPSGLSDSDWPTDSGAAAVYGEGESDCLSFSPDGDACDEAWSLNEYGRLYNWYAVDDARGLCPSGWHVPTDGEWTVLTNELGGDTIAGGKMKTDYGWESNNGTNSSGFSGLPGGYRLVGGASFVWAGGDAIWWSSSPNDHSAWYRKLTTLTLSVNRYFDNTRYGFSVRCIQDPE